MMRSTAACQGGLAAYAAFFATAALLLAGCTTEPWFGSRMWGSRAGAPTQPVGVQPGYYRVGSGDTLASVAAGFGQRAQDIAEWNRLPLNASLMPGHVLRVAPPVGANANSSGAPSIRFAWPAHGEVLKPAQPGAGRSIIIAGRSGDPVRAAADGTVIYVGSGMEQYAALVIVKHGESLVTAYSVNASLPAAQGADFSKGAAVLVKEGDEVRKGQPLAQMGPDKTGRASVQFEIRREGSPIDPLAYLPR